MACGPRDYDRRMAKYGLWETIRHYMVSGSSPSHESDSIDELYDIGRSKGWYPPGSAVIAKDYNGKWVAESWVHKKRLKDLPLNQPAKYLGVREGQASWPNHLDGPPSRS